MPVTTPLYLHIPLDATEGLLYALPIKFIVLTLPIIPRPDYSHRSAGNKAGILQVVAIESYRHTPFTLYEMSQPPAHKVLLHPPFFVIPGISPTSPISQQTEQIDQLNTLLLQEIDANFAKFHQIITSKILPQIKRYAIASEPVKEGAKVTYQSHAYCLS